MVGKGLLGQYAGFVSRTVGLVLDIVIVIAIIGIVNFAITLPLEYFLGFNATRCASLVSNSAQLAVAQEQWFCIAVALTQSMLSLLAGPAYFILFWSMGGQTVGQYVAGVRVVRLDGRKMNFKSSLVRYVGYFVSFFALGLGYLWVLWDDRRQGFHDMMARTVVVYSWAARQNEFLLDRVAGRLLPKNTSGRPLLSEAEIQKLRYVVVNFKQHTEMNGALSALEEAVRSGTLDVLNVGVLVKDEDGHMGLVGVSDLAAKTSVPAPMISVDFRQIKTGLENLLLDYPANSFIVVILVRPQMERAVTAEIQRLNVPFEVLKLTAVLEAVHDAARPPAGPAEQSEAVVTQS